MKPESSSKSSWKMLGGGWLVITSEHQNLSFLRKGLIIFRLHGSVSVLFTGPNPQSVLQMFVHWSLHDRWQGKKLVKRSSWNSSTVQEQEELLISPCKTHLLWQIVSDEASDPLLPRCLTKVRVGWKILVILQGSAMVTWWIPTKGTVIAKDQYHRNFSQCHGLKAPLPRRLPDAMLH